MNRRTALFSSLLLGGLLPASLRAQTTGTRRSGGARIRPVAEDDTRPIPNASSQPVESLEDLPAPGDDAPPADFPKEAGHAWRTFDITHYSSLPHGQNNTPQTAITDWIFRRTGSIPWHGDKIAVLSASRTQ